MAVVCLIACQRSALMMLGAPLQRAGALDLPSRTQPGTCAAAPPRSLVFASEQHNGQLQGRCFHFRPVVVSMGETAADAGLQAFCVITRAWASTAILLKT